MGEHFNLGQNMGIASEKLEQINVANQFMGMDRKDDPGVARGTCIVSSRKLGRFVASVGNYVDTNK